mmetsp:Transcript_18392/g.58373  ORF Transcript_18392/g.58373 Transcript_18392/m.58373 type:complete len:180 (-) Transcript_18392:60-599(-)
MCPDPSPMLGEMWGGVVLGSKPRSSPGYSITQGMRAGSTTWSCILLTRDLTWDWRFYLAGDSARRGQVVVGLLCLMLLALPSLLMSLQPADMPGSVWQPVHALQDTLCRRCPWSGHPGSLISVSLVLVFLCMRFKGIPLLEDQTDGWAPASTQAHRRSAGCAEGGLMRRAKEDSTPSPL